MAKELIIPSKFTIDDQFSTGFKKMTSQALADVEKFGGGMSKINSFIKNNQESIRKMGRNLTITGGVIAGGLGYATSQAVDFEKSMAGVAKYANVDIGSREFLKLGDQAKDLSENLGLLPQDTANLMQNLAGGGVAVKDLAQVTEIAGKMAVAFDIAGDVAGESFVKTKNALNLTIEETSAIMDSINQLGNTYAANSDQILEFMALGGAGVANSLKAGGDAVAAFGSRLISMGETSSTAATIMQAFTRTVNKNSDLSKLFQKAGGGAEGMFAVIEHGSKLTGEAQKKFFSKFGNYGLAIQNLASNTTELRNAMDLATDATGRAGSVQAEFDNVSNTNAARLQKLKIQFSNMAITVGEALLPVVTDLANTVSPMIASFSQWIKENKSLVSSLVKITATVGGLMLAVGPLLYMVGSIHRIMDSAKKAIDITSIAMKGFGKASTFAMGPVGLLIAAVAGGIAVYNGFSSVTKKAATNQELFSSVAKRASENSLQNRVEAKLLFNQLKENKAGTDEYKNALQGLDSIMPGITQKYLDKNGVVKDAIALEREYMGTLKERAMEEARMEIMKEKYAESLRRKEEGPGFWDVALAMVKNPFSSPLSQLGAMSIAEDSYKNVFRDSKRLEDEADRLSMLSFGGEKPSKNLSDSQIQQVGVNNKSEVVLKIDNGGNTQVVDLSGGQSFGMTVVPASSSTMK